jgi:hypothetical protein
MKAHLSCVLALLVATALHVGSSAASGSVPLARLTHCAATADQAALAAHSKANSFAPHPASQSRVYGAPIQTRILKTRPKKKPQLTSTPLPAS